MSENRLLPSVSESKKPQQSENALVHQYLDGLSDRKRQMLKEIHNNYDQIVQKPALAKQPRCKPQSNARNSLSELKQQHLGLLSPAGNNRSLSAKQLKKPRETGLDGSYQLCQLAQL